MRNTQIVGIAGPKGSGKDYVARLAMQIITSDASVINGESRVEIAAFADPIKKFLAENLGLKMADLYGSDEDKNKPTEFKWDDLAPPTRARFMDRSGCLSVRECIQIFGTDVCRHNWRGDIWIKAMLTKIHLSTADWFFVPDVRFPAEAGALKSIGASIWKIVEPWFRPEYDGHETETEIDKITASFKIDNHPGREPGTLEKRIREALQQSI